LDFFVTKFYSGNKTEKQGRFKSLKFSLKKYYIHLHHGFIWSIILLLFYIIDFYNSLIYGFLIGLIVQGLTYNDFYKFYYKKN